MEDGADLYLFMEMELANGSIQHPKDRAFAQGEIDGWLRGLEGSDREWAEGALNSVKEAEAED